VPGSEAEPLAYLFTDILDGRNASLVHGVQEVLERQPSSLRSFARRAAAAGAWS
jgi:hypothetical protein